MREKLYFLLLIILFSPTEKTITQKPIPSLSIAINSTEAQIGEPLHDTWGTANSNFFYNFGDITNQSFSLSVIPKYFITEDICLRFEFGFTNIKMKHYYDSNPHTTPSPYSHNITNRSIQQKIFRYIPAIQWTFTKLKLIECFCGFSATYLRYSQMKYKDRIEVRVLATDALIAGTDGGSTATGGFAIGLGTFTGFNIRLGKHISCGAELSIAYLYYKIGGKYISEGTSLIPPYTYQTSSTSSSYKGFDFSKPLPSINISVRF